jgi:hypothetical protein
MANITKIYEDAERTAQIFPETNERAVYDNNGTPLNSKLGAIVDLVNQKQMEVGAVPIDLEPTIGNTTHVVSSDAVAQVSDKTNLALEQIGANEDYTAMADSDGTTVTGMSIGSDSYIIASGRSFIRYNVYAFKQRIRKVKVTAQEGKDARVVFAKSLVVHYTNLNAVDDTVHSVTGGTTAVLDVPVNTIMIMVNNYSTANVFPDYLGFMFEETNGGSLLASSIIESNKGKKGLDIDNCKYLNRDIVFTKNDVNVGDVVNFIVTLNLPDGADGTGFAGYIGLYDASGTLLNSVGKTSNNGAAASSYTLSYTVLNDFSYAQVLASTPNGINVTAKVAVGSGNEIIGLTSDFGEYTQVDLTDYPTATNCFVGPNSGTPYLWIVDSEQNGRVWRVVTIPSGAKFMKIVSQYVNSLFFLASWTTPVNGLLPDYAEPNPTMPTITSGEFLIPDGANYVIMMTHNKTIDISPSYVGFASVKPSIVADIEEVDTPLYGRQIESVSCPDAAVEVMATDDETATQYDNLNIGYFNVVKVSDSMYYMYYSCIGKNDQYGDNYQHLAFAYSTDSLNWTRGIPSGIEAPISGTNLIFQEKVMGVQVFKVMDNDYPFRMLASYDRKRTRMYKSADGVNFTLIREVFPFYCDNQVSCIVRGNIVKVYIRWRSDVTGSSTSTNTYRWIGVCTMDIDGNLISPVTTFCGRFFYQASASILDERREVMFPTVFNSETDTQRIHCYIIDDLQIKRIPFDTSNLIANDELSFYVAPSLINVGSDMYLYMTCRTTAHNSFTSNNVTRVKRVKVTFATEGTYWIHA